MKCCWLLLCCVLYTASALHTSTDREVYTDIVDQTGLIRHSFATNVVPYYEEDSIGVPLGRSSLHESLNPLEKAGVSQNKPKNGESEPMWHHRPRRRNKGHGRRGRRRGQKKRRRRARRKGRARKRHNGGKSAKGRKGNRGPKRPVEKELPPEIMVQPRKVPGNKRHGQSEKMQPKFCRCRKVKGLKSICFYVTNQRSMRCRAQSCDQTFKCVANESSKGTAMCIRRHAIMKVVRNPHRDGFCERVAIDEFFYVPYYGAPLKS